MADMTLPLFPVTYEIHSAYQPDARIVLYTGLVEDYLKTVPSGSVRLIVTSPPYNLGKSYESRTSIERYLETQSAIIKGLIDLLADDGSICWQVGNYVQDGEVFPLDIYYYGLFKQHGLSLRNRVIWHFGHGLHASKRFSGRYETLLWFTKSKQYIFNLDEVRVPSKYPGKLHYKGDKRGQPSGNPKGKNPSDIWEVVAEDWESCLWDIPNVKSNHPEKTEHPCQFPVELVERCVLALTQEDDWVFDPFAGVGSSLIAGLRHNRRVMGCEKEPQYLETAVHRIGDHFNGTLKTRPLGRPVHQPTGREKVTQTPQEWLQHEKDDEA
ncbi:MAG: site-specific DNA-methyltransferase [Anaerolineae bacterium]|nr:site-specific DNA-methyltransferase [Anaerolineae bacterium]NUQ04186.1 site-specific DNA-methyltransferase [Anaerolineae bacterium]